MPLFGCMVSDKKTLIKDLMLLIGILLSPDKLP